MNTEICFPDACQSVFLAAGQVAAAVAGIAAIAAGLVAAVLARWPR